MKEDAISVIVNGFCEEVFRAPELESRGCEWVREEEAAAGA